LKTIKEIAEIANVSTGTVDRVIHNRDSVSEKTRQKVLKILEENNYQRNMIASTLAKQKKHVIATLIPSTKTKSDFWELPKQGIINAYDAVKDYGFTVKQYYFDQFDENSFINQFNDIVKESPDAVLIAPIFYNQTKKFVKLLSAKKIPYLFININLKGLDNISFIGQDSYQGGAMGAKLMSLFIRDSFQVLIVRKKRKINNHYAIKNRIEGFIGFLKNTKKDIIINQLEIDDNDEKHILIKTLRKTPLIKGVFVPSSFVNIVANYLNDNNLKDINLIGYDINEESSAHVKNGIIDFLITQKSHDQGYKGVKILADYLLLNKIPEAVYNSPIEIITKENIDYYTQ